MLVGIWYVYNYNDEGEGKSVNGWIKFGGNQNGKSNTAMKKKIV